VCDLLIVRDLLRRKVQHLCKKSCGVWNQIFLIFLHVNFDTETTVDSRHAELASKPEMLKSVSTVQDFTHQCLGDCLRESGDFIAVNLDFIHLTRRIPSIIHGYKCM
jgi:hypothetical protein